MPVNITGARPKTLPGIQLDYDKIRRVSRVVVRMLDALQKDKLDDF